MDSFGTSLLRVTKISPRNLIVAVAMQQLANPKGIVEITDAKLVTFVNRLSEGQNFQRSSIKQAIKELIAAGIMLTDRQVRPIDSNSGSSISKEEAEILYKKQIHDNGRNTAPDEAFSEIHARLYGALRAINMTAALMKIKRVPLKDAENETVIVEGRIRMVNKLVWDYGQASALLNQYGLDYILDRCFRYWQSTGRKRIPPVIDSDDPKINHHIQSSYAYLIGCLGSVTKDREEVDEPLVFGGLNS